jgi:hypothetical protein
MNTARGALAQHHLMTFLSRLPKLRSVGLDLSGHLSRPDSQSELVALTTVHDVFGSNHVWPDLQELSLRYFNTTACALLSMLQRHRATLKNLQLHAMYLEQDETASVPQIEWPNLLQDIKAILQLEKASTTGYIRNFRDLLEWNFDVDPELADATGKFLSRDENCPLKVSNTHPMQTFTEVHQ